MLKVTGAVSDQQLREQSPTARRQKLRQTRPVVACYTRLRGHEGDTRTPTAQVAIDGKIKLLLAGGDPRPRWSSCVKLRVY